MRLLLVPLALLVCLASATPYQSSGWRGGYTERPLGKDQWLITVEVNGYTSGAKAVEYTYRRAAELCPNGFDILGKDRGEDVSSYNGNVTSKANATLAVRCRHGDE